MPKRRAIWILLAILLLYPISYLVTGRNGSYSTHSLPPLTNQLVSSFGLRSEKKWEPFPEQRKSNEKIYEILHTLFYPLIQMDRLWWHRSEELEPEPFHTDPNMDMGPTPLPAMPFPISPPMDSHEA